MHRVTTRASRYYHYVLHTTLAQSLPAEIALLPIIESGFDPFAYSPGRAAGAWQFIPNTGRVFGLKQNWWYDGRRDIVASTQAAHKYLTQLHKMFDGDWLLAIASYNGGQGTVLKAIKRNKKAGKPTDFWSLNLPKETMNYVPKLLAVAKVVAQTAGTKTLFSVKDEAYFEAIDVGSQIDLSRAAMMANISLEELSG
ncbi:MAG TPA: lytic transglycosylase, partial [Oceanospirillaceae bacterium]|nr:lytic transglycosylase [Oceanospirillaceae bacterium]